MEPEKQRLIWQEAVSAVLVMSSGKTVEQTIDLISRLVAEASTHDPQMLSLQSIPVSLGTTQLEIWAYSLAAELMRQWQAFEDITPKLTKTLAELGLISAEEGPAPLIDAMGKAGAQKIPIVELKERLQNLYKQQQKQKFASSKLRVWLEQEAAQLAQWFNQMPTADSLMFQSPEEMSGCLVKLQLYAPTLHTQTLQTFNACFAQLQLSGSQVVLAHLNGLSQTLQNVLADYDVQRQERLRRESGAWRAYRNLMTQIETRQWGSGKGDLAWEAVLRALNLIYVSKLEAEAYTLASQIVSDLIMKTHQYAVAISQTDTLLTHLQNWFIQNCPPESKLSPILKSFLTERINPGELRRQLEQWTGHSLLDWGTVKSIPLEMLREQILVRLHPICLAVYGECCASLALGVCASNIQLATVKHLT